MIIFAHVKVMIGYFSSIDFKRKNGYIKEKNTNCTYYFAFTSISDSSLKPFVGQHVFFDLFQKNDHEKVAVRIRPKAASEHDSFIKATIAWFSAEKRYGYVTCENSCDAFLHIKKLEKIGLQTISKGRPVKVKLGDSKYPGKKEVVDIIVDCENSYPYYNNCQFNNSVKHSSRCHTMKNCSSNDFTAIPSSSSNETSSAVESHKVRSFRTSTGSPQQYSAYNSKSYTNSHSYPLSPPTMPGTSGVFPMPPFPTSPRVPNPGMANIPSFPHQLVPLYRNSCSPARNNVPVHINHTNLSSMNQRGRPRHFTPKPTKLVTNPEYAKIKQQIHQKEGLLKHINLSKLPDAGQRLRDQIKELNKKLESLSMDNKDDKLTELTSQKENKPTVHELQTSLSDYFSKKPYNKSTYYGDGLTSKPMAIVQKVTVDAIEKLHISLNTCPPSITEIADPDGLNVTLMTHQRQALAWLVWREKQVVNGGILADDMGLGKTLTMIALIMTQSNSIQKQSEKENENCEEKYETKVIPNENKAIEDNGELNKKLEQDPLPSLTSDSNSLPAEILCHSTLIVAPASLIYHWKNEIRNRCRKGLFSIHLYHGSDREKDAEKLAEFDIVITTYDIVRRSDTNTKTRKTIESISTDISAEKPNEKSSDALKGALFQIKWRRIILDEAHQIRNFKSQTSQAVCSLQSRSRWALSGTPIQNEEDDMFAMIKFLHCEPFDQQKVWKNQVANKTKQGRERLKILVSCLVLRREKQQKDADGKPLVNLPKREFKIHKLKLNDVECQVYNKLSEESRSAYQKYEEIRKAKTPMTTNKSAYNRDRSGKEQKLSATALLVQLLRMRQCCGHLHLLKNNFDVELLQKEKQQVAVEDLLESLTLKEEMPSTEFEAEKYLDEDKSCYFDISHSSSKIEAVMNMIHTLNFEKPNDKIVVISQWTSMLRIIGHRLQKDKLTYDVIEGGVSAKTRMNLVDEFNRNPVKPKIMLVSLQAGGVGLNLTGGNHLFLLDMHWNPALEKQAFDRIYRVGQTKDVYIHKFVVEGTVEEQILKLQEEKLAVANSVMEGADVEKKAKLTLSDMKVLFNL